MPWRPLGAGRSGCPPWPRSGRPRSASPVGACRKSSAADATPALPDLTPPAEPPSPRLLAGLLARCSFPPAATRVDVAVSGGADSLALLVLAVEAGCEVTAHHVDHGLRE